MNILLRIMRIGTMLFIVLFAISCEKKSEDSLTLDDIYNATQEEKEDFAAKIEGFNFTADYVAGGKEGNTFYFIGANVSGASIVVRTMGIQPGLYLGIDSSSNNILYKDAQGYVFSTISENKKPDAKISIRSYSQKNALATGVFSGTLYNTVSQQKLVITDGEFNSMKIVYPFLGKMMAEIEGGIFTAENCFSFSASNNGNTTQFIVGKANNEIENITLTIKDSIKVQSYDIADLNATANYNANVNSSNLNKYSYNGVSGSINVVRIDVPNKVVYGNFGFEAINNQGDKISVKYGDFEALIE